MENEEKEVPGYKYLAEEAIIMMQSKLPEYVVNCFVASGYDTLSVIADMDVSSNQDSSFNKIEDFINSEYPGDPKYIHISNSSSLKFPPGHRQTIAKFVQEVSSLEAEKQRLCRKREASTSTSLVKPKKKRFTSMPPEEILTSEENLSAKGHADICRQIVSWQKKQQTMVLKHLKQHEHYEVNVKNTARSKVASILCKLCSKSYSLAFVDNHLQISNWTRHIKKCALAPKKRKGMIEKYLSLDLPSAESMSMSDSIIGGQSDVHNTITEVPKKPPFLIAPLEQVFRLSPPS